MNEERRRAGEQDAVGRAQRTEGRHERAAGWSQIVHSRRPTSEPRGTGRRRQPDLRQAPLASRLVTPSSPLPEASPTSVTAWPLLGQRLRAHLHVLARRRRNPAATSRR